MVFVQQNGFGLYAKPKPFYRYFHF